MKFQFEGQTYVIGFAHDKSRDWAAHEGHAVQLTRIIRPVELPGVSLFCVNCALLLSHVPKSLRGRLTECSIFRVSSIEGGVSKLEVAHGIGRCNPKDRWTREAGRIAALRNALRGTSIADATLVEDAVFTFPDGSQMPMPRTRQGFVAAAWEVYQTRHWNTQVRQLADADRALARAREQAQGGVS